MSDEKTSPKPLLDAQGKVIVRNGQYCLFVGEMRRLTAFDVPIDLGENCLEVTIVDRYGNTVRVNDRPVSLLIRAEYLERVQ